MGRVRTATLLTIHVLDVSGHHEIGPAPVRCELDLEALAAFGSSLDLRIVIMCT